MSKKAKTALGIAASIFVPMAAPWMAGALLSGSTLAGSAAATTALASGIGAVGSGLGTEAAGGDWRKGALGGALTGGFLGATGSGLFGGVEGGAKAFGTGARGFEPSVVPEVAQPAVQKAAQPGFLDTIKSSTAKALPQIAVQGGLGVAGAREQEKLVAEQQRQFDIQNTREQEQFGRQLQAAEEMRAQAAQFDPQQAGLAQAGTFQRQLAQQEREYMRGMGGRENQARRQAASRAYDIASATGRGTQYAQGAQQAGAQQRATLESAARMVPGVPKHAGLTIGDLTSIGSYTSGRVQAAGKALEPVFASDEDKKRDKQTT